MILMDDGSTNKIFEKHHRIEEISFLYGTNSLCIQIKHFSDQIFFSEESHDGKDNTIQTTRHQFQ